MLILFKIFMSILLLIGIISPKTAWKISEGWKFRNVEPSTAYLVVNRIMATVIFIVIWFVMPN